MPGKNTTLLWTGRLRKCFRKKPFSDTSSMAEFSPTNFNASIRSFCSTRAVTLKWLSPFYEPKRLWRKQTNITSLIFNCKNRFANLFMSSYWFRWLVDLINLIRLFSIISWKTTNLKFFELLNNYSQAFSSISLWRVTLEILCVRLVKAIHWTAFRLSTMYTVWKMTKKNNFNIRLFFLVR